MTKNHELHRSLSTVAVCVCVCVCFLFFASAAVGQTSPNVLLIAVDDLRTELGCYGVADAQSPHLDRFARQAILFNHHYVQVPTCGASRYALLTGRSPRNSGVTSNNAALYQGATALKADSTLRAASMPELFRKQGYRTVCIGKISHTPDGRVFAYNGKGDGRPELPNAWDELATPFGEWKRGWGTFFAYAGGRHREDGQGHRDLMEFVAQEDHELPDGMMADVAIEKLAELKHQGQPFFMGLGFFKPHLPFVATRGDWDAMQSVEVSPPSEPAPPDSPYWHRSNEFYKYDMTLAKEYTLTTEDAITARRAYLACVRYVDRQIGRVLAQLDELELSDNTIVVIWGDHGWHLGESALWGKHAPFERALQSTLLIRAPRVTTQGSKCDALVETVDLYPTLVDLCGLEPTTQQPLDGQSLKPLLADPSLEVRDFAISYWRQAVSVRSRNYRLIARPGKSGPEAIELYDLRHTKDPVKNVASSHPDVVAELLKAAAFVESGNPTP
jgi:arylsulfatase A-like enzyme